MRYEVRPCVGEKIKYYIVRHKLWWSNELRWYYEGSDNYSFDPDFKHVVYFDTAQEAEQKAIELFGTTARIDVRTVQL